MLMCAEQLLGVPSLLEPLHWTPTSALKTLGHKTHHDKVVHEELQIPPGCLIETMSKIHVKLLVPK
jgi:hypothetical protein